MIVVKRFRGGMCLQTVCKVEEQGRYLDNEAWYILLPRGVEQKGRNKKEKLSQAIRRKI